MDVRKLTIEEYTNLFAGSDPAPGGGGAAGVIAALAAAAGEMVCSLTLGKKKYESIEPEIKGIALRLNDARDKLLSLSDKDAEAFEPLSKAYRDPVKNDEEMDILCENAAGVPLEIMRVTFSILEEIDFLTENGSRLAVSDAGCAAEFARAAIASEILNVKINTRHIKNQELRKEIDDEADVMYDAAMKKCDMIFSKVMEVLK